MKLARLMVEIGKKFSRRVTCVLSPMDEPLPVCRRKRLGGSAKRYRRCVESGPNGFRIETVCDLAGELLYLAEADWRIQQAMAFPKPFVALRKGLAAEKFQRMIEAQAGDGH